MTRVFYGTGDAPPAAAPPAGISPGLAGRIVNNPGKFVELTPIKTVLCSWEPIRDGPTRLYDLLTYECIALLNPAATSYASPAGEAVPAATPDERATATHNAIRHFMMTERKRLIITIADKTLVTSPAPGRVCDAANGPFPYRFDILDVLGNQTLVVRWGIQTYVNPCEKITANKASALLSSRWRSERTVDQDGYSSITYHGHSIFDAGKLEALQQVPDEYWDLIAPPIDKNFRRLDVQVVATEDGNELEWVVIDRETPMVLHNVGIARAEVAHTSTNAQGDIFKVLGEGASSTIKGAAIGSALGPIGAVGGALVGFLSGAAKATTPVTQHQIRVRLWGSRRSDKKKLEEWGRLIIAQLLVNCGVGSLAKQLSGYTNSITRDGAGKFVELNSVVIVPAVVNATLTSEEKFGFDKHLWPGTPKTESITCVDKKALLSDGASAEAFNPPLPGGDQNKGGTRGVWLAELVSQKLTRTCQKQRAPVIGKQIPTRGGGVGANGLARPPVPTTEDKGGLE